MRVYAAELICSTGVLGFHTLKLALCIHNKLRSHAEILSWWAFDVTFPGSNPLRSNRSGLNVSNGGSWNPKLTLKVNGLWIKMKGQNFASQVLSRHTFRISRKKGSDFFDHRGTLNWLHVCFMQSLCARWIALARARAKTVFSHLKFDTHLEENSARSFQNVFDKSTRVLNLVFPRKWIFHELRHILGYHTPLNFILFLVYWSHKNQILT